MTYNDFVRIMDNYRETKSIVNSLMRYGIDIIDCKSIDAFYSVFDICMRNSYNESGLSWIYYYLDELPDIKEQKKRNGDTSPYALDEDGEAISLETDLELYNLIQNFSI